MGYSMVKTSARNNVDEVASTIKLNLKAASEYLLLYTLFSEKIISTVRYFFGGETEQYKSGLSLTSYPKGTHRMIPSFDWAGKLGFSVNTDMIRTFIDHRNDIAHELPKVLEKSSFVLETKRLLEEMCSVSDDFIRWWLLTVESTTNPFLVDHSITDETIDPLGMSAIYNMIK